METATLVRDETGPTGTFGRFATPTFECYTLERPAEGDHPCIPAGVYQVEWLPHPQHGDCYELLNVPKRTAILIHSANWYDQLLGCIAPGRSIGPIKRKDGAMMKGVTSSKDAVAGLLKDLGALPFTLAISWQK